MENCLVGGVYFVEVEVAHHSLAALSNVQLHMMFIENFQMTHLLRTNETGLEPSIFEFFHRVITSRAIETETGADQLFKKVDFQPHNI
jgi:hypothetical protein